MRLIATLLLLTAIALGVFAWWGTSTADGRARYDEMDGLYPLGAGLLAILLGLLGLVAIWFATRRSRH